MSKWYLSLLCQPILLTTAFALPTGGQVEQGQAALREQARLLQIEQTSHRAVIEYDSFSIGRDETVRIRQPNQDSVLLNKVRQGGPMSEIYGQLEANGQVFLVNPAGILVGESATIDVGGLLLTTHEIDNHEFLSGQFQTAQGAPSVIQIDGRIEVDPGSFVMVVAPSIELGGDIVAQFGRVSLIAADGASLLLQPGQWPDIQVTQSTLDAWIHHHGLIDATGGLVELTAASASDLIDRVIFHEGTTSVATTEFVERDGRLFIEKPTSAVKISTNETQGYVDLDGEIDASGDVGAKTIDVTAKGIVVQSSAKVRNNGVMGDAGDTHVLADYLQVKEGARFEVKGGEQGNGGFIELSGFVNLDLRGDVDLSAPGGEVGHLLIDPRNVIINNSTQTSIDSRNQNGTQVLEPTGDSAIVNAQNLLNILETGDVTVTTEDNSNASNQVGTLQVAVDLDLDQIDGTTLTLRANDRIFIDADIEDKGVDNVGGNANIVLEATRDIEMSQGTSINSGTGTISITSEEADFTLRSLESAATNTTAISIDVGGSIVDTNDSANNIVLTGENAALSLVAGSNIDNLEGFAPIFSASAPDVRGFTQTLAGDLLINRVESTAPSVVGFRVSTLDGDIIVRGQPGETEPGIRIGGDGPLFINAGGNNADILLEANLSTVNGAMQLSSSAGGIFMSEDTVLESVSGDIALSSQSTQTLGLLSTGSVSDSAISLEVIGSEDILDGHDTNSDRVNIQAPGGGLDIVNADNVVSIETDVERFRTSSVSVSQIVLQEVDDIILSQVIGTITSLDLVAGGDIAVDQISTGGTIALTADRILEFYEDEADRVANIDVASIEADRIALIAASNIGDVTDGRYSVVDYLDVSTTDLSVELTQEVANVGVNEIAVQQVSSQNLGDLVITSLQTPDEAGSARLFFASLNNGIDLSALQLPTLASDPTITTLDSTDVLGLSIRPRLDPNPSRIVLPSLDQLQNWSLAGLMLDAKAAGASIVTRDTNGPTLLTAFETDIDKLVWNSNHDQTLSFGGSELDISTSLGNIDVQANGALRVLDLDDDNLSLSTDSGNINLNALGTLNLSGVVAAFDIVNDGERAGLIDIATDRGDIVLGEEDLTLRSINDVDSDVNGGLGVRPTEQTAIRIAQNGRTGSADISVGSLDSSVTIEAQGGDIYISAGAQAVSRSVDERTLTIFENTVIEAFENPADTLSAVQITEENEVTLVDETLAAASIATGPSRSIELTSRNIAGFELTPAQESETELAIDDAIQVESANDQAPQVSEPPADTPLDIVVDSVVPGCESGQSVDNSSQCLKNQGFKEFLKSLVLGRGFPKTIKETAR